MRRKESPDLVRSRVSYPQKIIRTPFPKEGKRRPYPGKYLVVKGEGLETFYAKTPPTRSGSGGANANSSKNQKASQNYPVRPHRQNNYSLHAILY
jgi:hypothetical protein